jgi:hypothetical protein
VITRRVADHHAKSFNPARAWATCHGIIAGRHEGRAQVQVFGGVAADRQLGREHQAGALRIGLLRRIDDLARIAGHVADDEIERQRKSGES